MTRAELIAWASPPCRTCGLPVQHVEMRWEQNGDRDWVPAVWRTVCAEGHRIPVERFP